MFTASRCFGLFGLRALDAAAAFFLPAIELRVPRSLLEKSAAADGGRGQGREQRTEIYRTLSETGERGDRKRKRSRKISSVPKGSAWAPSWA